MTSNLVVRSEAEEEVRDVVRLYGRSSARLGAEFITEFSASLDHIRLHPDAGTLLPSGVRRRLLARFPFAVIYLQLPGRIEIVAVVHQRRDPGYWLDRL